MHSAVHQGLQKHSIGELYPWTIMVRKSPAVPNGVVVPVNCLTQYYGPTFDFESFGESFLEAHRKAEQWIKDLPPEPATYVDAMEELSRLGYPETLSEI